MSYSEEELAKLGRAFAELGAKPGQTPQEIDSWVSERGAIKKEPMNVSTTQHVQSSPRLPTFSGLDGNGEVSFSLWEFEVGCLKAEGVEEANVMQAIRRALRGPAANVLLNLGKKATVEELLAKLEVIFGDVCTSESILETFFSAKQMARESVAAWGCRLEQMLGQAKKKKAVGSGATTSMLRSKFWSGLADADVKMALRHLYDEDANFSKLLMRARAVEGEFGMKRVRVAEQVADPVVAKLDEILKRIGTLEGRVQAVEDRQSTGEEQTAQKHTANARSCYRCGSLDHLVRECPSRQGNGRGPTGEGPGWVPRM